MKKILSTMLVLTCGMVVSAQTRTVKVTVANDWSVDRTDEPVVVKLKEVKQLGLGTKASRKSRGFEVKGARVMRDGREVACQLDDMDGDLLADEVFFLADVKGGEKAEFEVELSGKETEGGDPLGQEAQGKGRVYTALQIRDKQDKHPDVLKVEASGKSFLFNDIYMHGVTIESELVGYRIYFDHRQNIDLYGKKYRRIELPETQFYTSVEQLAQGYGVDVLWAGNAIGCGSFKDMKDGEWKPENWTNVKVRGQRVVTAGPLRTVVEVYDLGVTAVDGQTFDMHQYYSLYAGHRDLKVDVQFDRPLSKKFCTGVQKVGVTAADSVRRGHQPEGMFSTGFGTHYAASWGCDYPDMGKKQQWPPEAVGLAVYVPKDCDAGWREDELNYLRILQCDKTNAIHYYVSFCADKEEQGYHTAQKWFASLEEWNERLEHPVKVKVEK